MLQDMGDAGGIHWHRTEGHEKYIFGMVAAQMIMHGTGYPMAVLFHYQLERGNSVAAFPFESGVKILGSRTVVCL